MPLRVSALESCRIRHPNTSQELQLTASLSFAMRGLMVALVIAMLAACQKSQSQPPATPPPEVSVVIVQPQDLPTTFEYVAQISGVREVEVRPRVSGILQKWNFTEGSKVVAGQSLFTIDAAPFRRHWPERKQTWRARKRLMTRRNETLA